MGKNFLLPITYYPKRLSVVPPTRKKRVGFPTIFCERNSVISRVPAGAFCRRMDRTTSAGELSHFDIGSLRGGTCVCGWLYERGIISV